MDIEYSFVFTREKNETRSFNFSIVKKFHRETHIFHVS